MRLRLSAHEAIAIGRTVKPDYKHGNPAYSITDAQFIQIQELRHKGIIESCNNKDVQPQHVKHLWKKDNESSIFVKNPLYVEPEIRTLIEEMQTLHERSIKEQKKYAFEYPKFKRQKIKGEYCLVFDAADIHIGKICSSFETGETYNSQIAVQRVKDGLHGIISKVRGYKFEKVIFIAGNDILHIDNPKRTTTSGTPQDTDGMWYDNFMMAKRLLIEVIETLLTLADVEVVFNPSNHDFTHCFMLLDSVSSWFHNCKQITFNNNMAHRKYTVYGNNLIGTTHMDGAKVDKLHGLMAEEASEFWHKCKHRYIYGHHVHHKTAKDVFSVCIETLRSPSGTDGWHHRNGFAFAPKAVEAFIHHKQNGQEAKIIHLF